jgi:amino acid adenylation domain-containing protein
MLQQGFIIWAEDGELAFRGARRALSDPLQNQIAARKTELLALLGKEQKHSPLSFAQQTVWFAEQMNPGSPLYNVPWAVRLLGALDLPVLHRALDEIVRRHEIIRAKFTTIQGQPVQVITPHAGLELPLVDLQQRSLSQSEQEEELFKVLRDEAARPFDLRQDLLIRATLVRLGTHGHVLVLVMHHIVSDGWSVGILMRELSQLYDAFLNNQPSPLLPPPIQYADYAVWQREWLKGTSFTEQLSYWEQQLEAAPEGVEWPSDRARVPGQRRRGALATLQLPNRLTRALKELSEESGVTLFMTLLAAFDLLLSRHTGQEDVVVGTRAAGRNRSETEQLVGFFINALPLRVDLSGNPKFRELLARVREVTLNAYACQDVPFEILVKKLQPQRDPARSPLFQIMFVLHNFPFPVAHLPGVKSEWLAVQRDTCKFDIDFSWFDGGDGLCAEVEYNTELFDSPSVERMLSQYQILLEGIIADPDQRVMQLPLTREFERRQLLFDLQVTHDVATVCLHELFNAQAERTPNATAIIDGNVRMTYKELNGRANQLAHALRAFGVGPDVPVAVFMERSYFVPLALLGVLKAGGAYVPIDPTYPAAHIEYVLRDSRAKVLLTREALAYRLAGHQVRVIRLDSEWPQIAFYPERQPNVEVHSNHLSHIVYTSGSTGEPKGVAVPQKQLLNRLAWRWRVHPFTEGEIVAQRTAISFSVSLAEMLEPLLKGVPLVVIPDVVASDPRRLVEMMDSHRVSRVVMVPSLLSAILDADLDLQHTLSDLRLCAVCGEKLTPTLCQRFREYLPQVTLLNQYGASEVNDITWFDTRDLRAGQPNVPIGRPVDHVELYLLDDNLQPAAAGIPGEIFVGGPGLARGYWNRDDLTAERFITNPFKQDGTSRLYKTGDLARHLPGGSLEYLGRRDDQVKIRGVRVDVRGIESILVQHPSVQRALVIAAERLDNVALVAYVILQEKAALTVSQLRRFLQDRLPDAMIPAFFVCLDAFPLLPNGKVNRRALPKPDSARPELEKPFVAPGTATESVLGRAWAEILGLEQVGIHDNFFELGGHSLLAARLAFRMGELLGVEVPMRLLFESPTIFELAQTIDAREGGSLELTDSSLPAMAVDPASRNKPFSLTDVQQAYWVGRTGDFEMGNIAAHSYMELDSEGLDLERFESAWQRLIVRHDMLRAIVQSDGRQRILENVPPYCIQTRDLRGEDPSTVASVLAEIREQLSHQVMHTDRWPLFEIRATVLEGNRTRLHFSVDAMIADAWSLGILVQELTTLYKNPERDLEPIRLSFRDYVVAENALQNSELYRRSLAYWRDRLPALSPAPELPLARNPASITQPQFVRRESKLARSVWEALKSRASQAGLSPAGAMLSAFAEVLARWSKSQRFTMNVPQFNRLPFHPDVSQLVGEFASFILLEIDSSKRESFKARARRLQGQLWQDLNHRYVGGVQVLRELKRIQGPASQAVMPVVFTSTFGLPATGLDTLGQASELGKVVFGVSQTPQVWLDCQVTEGVDSLDFHWDAVEEIFPQGLLDDMFGAYCDLLQRLAQDAELWLDEPLEVLSLPGYQLEQRTRINATERPIPVDMVHTLFAAQAKARPEHPAVIASAMSLSYGQLSRISNQVARWLRERGAQPNRLVAVVMEKGWEQVVAMMGIFQSGAACLPIDIDSPPERLRYLLEDGRVELVLTQSNVQARLEWPAGLTCLKVDDPSALSHVDDDPVPPSQTPDDLAYVIYTSGSTGVPKGAMLTHRGLFNAIVYTNEQFHIGPKDRALALTALHHDMSMFDLFGMLAAGGTIIVPDAAMRLDPAHWADLIAREAVTIWNSVPALMEALTQHLSSSSGSSSKQLPDCLRLAFLGGDWIPVTLPDRIRSLAKNVNVVSVGGPTETTLWNIWYPVKSVPPDWKSIPYGVPIANTKYLVLNERFEECPVWVPGELCCAGIGVAKGYWRDQERTAARFITHPQTGERIYRTGDLGRYLPDGNIEFLGRADYQVKSHGLRIELGEIEANLLQHPEVRSAIVVALGEPGKHKRLVAYVVPAKSLEDAVDDGSEQDALTRDLQTFLQRKLPAYMVPAEFLVLPALPLTANGKVNRQALPAPEEAPKIKDETGFVAPRNVLEEQIASIWAGVLSLQGVGVHDNFFELGGHSVLAMQLMSRVRETFQVELPMRKLFQEPTVAGLAAEIEQHRRQQRVPEVSTRSPVAIVPNEKDRYEPFPLTDVQQAYWVGRGNGLALGNVASHVYWESEMHGLNLTAFEGAWNKLIERHDMLRMIVRPDGQQQFLAHVPPYRIEILDLREATSETAHRRMQSLREQLSHQMFPTDKWPLFEIRASLLEGGRVRLHFSVDLLLGDAWSWLILTRELAEYYQNPAAVLPRLELSFRDYVLAERALQDAEEYQRSLNYWRKRIPALPPAPDLPLAKDPGALEKPRFMRRATRLEAEAWHRIKERTAHAGLTPSAVLLAAFADVLATWSKTPQFTINLTLFNRMPMHPQVNEIIGDFTSLTLLEMDNAATQEFLGRAQLIQHQLWEDLDHRHVGGVQVIREMARLGGGAAGGAMPIVFTSNLNTSQSAAGTNVEHEGEPPLDLNRAENEGYGISQTPQIWLDHQVSEQMDALVFNWDAVEDLFPSGLLDDMFEGYCRLLRRLADDETAWRARTRDLVSLPKRELEQRATVNATAAPVSQVLLQELFAAQARQRPQHPAVISSDRTLTYGELARRANQIGGWLRQRGAQPNSLVAVVMEKGWEQVAAVLGILESGAAYLPISSDLPQERISYLLENGAATLLLTQSKIEERLLWPEHVQRLCIDRDHTMDRLDSQVLETIQRAEDLAYVIYTSGSTGEPKGVMIDHRGAVNTILDLNQRFNIGPEDRVLALSSLSFDLSVYDIFGLLAAGGTIVIPDPSARRDPACWLELLKDKGVTLWNSVPALMEMLVEYAEGQSERLPESLRLVFMSGDWIPVALPDRIRDLAGDVQLISMGGATEASIWSILYPIEDVDPHWHSIPYGKPMVNQTFHVLDDNLEPRPVWVPGHLYIGGIGVAKGYWRDEQKTREKFIVHPQTRELLYRTGDLGRYLPDGNIEFLGREDSQVKIQGHRIELGEIEAALEQHPEVRGAVVTGQTGTNGMKLLVGYVVLDRQTRDPEESKQQGQILNDPAERLRFKLSQHSAWQGRDAEPVALPRLEFDDATVDRYVSRRSYRNFESDAIATEKFSSLLGSLMQAELQGVPWPKARYGSAGSSYPVQAYIYVKPGRVTGVKAGIYYYHPQQHCLILISQDARLDQNLYPQPNRGLFQAAAFGIFLIARMEAIEPLYGPAARDYCLLEAGLMTQLLEMSAPDLGIGLCQTGGFEFSAVSHLFDLQKGHVYLHSLLGGAIPARQRQLPALVQESETLRSLIQLAQPPATNGFNDGESFDGSSNTDSLRLEEIQRFLRRKLPDHMVPSSWMVLESLPLTSNGKVDRKSLPKPEDAQASTRTHVAPSTPTERMIAAIWGEVLGVSKIGVQDNFFDLGGNSVHLVRIHAKLRAALGREFSIVEMFKQPTIHALATAVDSQGAPEALADGSDRAQNRLALRDQRRRSRQAKKAEVNA